VLLTLKVLGAEGAARRAAAIVVVWPAAVWMAVSADAVFGACAAWGFAWWSAYPVLVQRYWDGIATRRPFGYWVWGDLAALVFSAGPLVGASVAVALSRVRGIRSALRGESVLRGERVVVLLTVAALVTVFVADLSGMSKAEVERIWLPFVPWLLVGTALLPERWRRLGLAGQLCFALLVQHLLFTGW
jgi:hypothetical protein